MKKLFLLLLSAMLIAMFCIPRVAGESDKVLITMQIGNKTAYINGEPFIMDAAPVIVPPGRTVVPIRFISEGFGADVQWSGTTKTVTITMDSIPYIKNQMLFLESNNAGLKSENAKLKNDNAKLEDENDALKVALDKFKDSIPPEIVISEPANNSTVSASSITVRGNVSDNTDKIITLTVNGHEWHYDTSGNFSFNIDLPLDGTNIISIKASDRAGNTNEYVLTVYKQTRSWTLTDNEIQDAINEGMAANNDDDFIAFSEQYNVPGHNPQDPYRIRVSVKTPYYWVALSAYMAKSSGKTYTINDGRLTLLRWGEEVSFDVSISGSSDNFANNYSAKIKIGEKTIYPIDSEIVCKQTPYYPNYPQYVSFNTYDFNNSQIPRDATVTLVINDGHGGTESFVIDLSKMP